MILDELLAELNRCGFESTLSEGVIVSAIAFADDLIMLADKDADIPPVLATLKAFFASRGMRKSYSISCATKEYKSLENLLTWFTNIHRSPLKPDQNFCIIRQYTIPKLLYSLQILKITSKIFHMLSHTPDQFLYASLRDGGLDGTSIQNTEDLFKSPSQIIRRHLLSIGLLRLAVPKSPGPFRTPL